MSALVYGALAAGLIVMAACGGWGKGTPTPSPEPATTPTPASASPHQRLQRIEGAVARGQTLTSILLEAGIPSDQVHAAIRTLSDAQLSMRSLSVGNTYLLEVNEDGHLIHMEYSRAQGERYHLDASPVGGFIAHREQSQVEKRVQALSATLRTTLSEAVSQAGEGSGLTELIVDAFQWDINFYTEPQSGDTFQILYEKMYVDGQPTYRYGDVLAARYQGKTIGTKETYLFEKEYYDAKGRFARRGFLTAPLNVLKVTSRYGQRFHPILRQLKAHKGIDYGAPTGTPVWAIAVGKVIAAGDRGDGYGKKVVIQHAQGYQSLYAHLSSVSVAAGQSVRQKQQIGRVGRTGRATGAHLHFEIRVNGKHVDPGKIKLIPSEPISVKKLDQFLVEAARLKAQLEELSTREQEEQALPRPPWGWVDLQGEGRL